MNVYVKRERQCKLICMITIVVLVLFCVFSVKMFLPVTFSHSLYLWYVFFSPGHLDVKTSYDAVIVLMRIPRIMTCIIAGAALGVAGYVLQALTRNDLVSPFTIGIASASAFGATLSFFVMSSYILFPSIIAFLCSLLCIVIVVLVSRATNAGTSKVVLIGIALNYIFSAGSEFLRFFAKDRQLDAIVQWSFGTMNKIVWDHVYIPFILVIIIMVILSSFSLRLFIFANNSKDVLKTLGISYVQTICIVGGLSVFMTSIVISITGVIGFLGLIGPHIAKLICRGYNGYSFFLSGALSSLLLVVSDFIGRIILIPADVPAGIIISFIGVPLFIHLLWRDRSNA